MKTQHRRIVCAILFLLSFLTSAWAQTSTGAEGAVSAANSIDTLQVTQRGGNTVIKVSLAKPLASEPSSFSVANPARVVFDFPATANGLGRTSQQVNEGDLRSINIVQVGDRTRMVLNLNRVGNFQGAAEGNAFLVTLSPAPAAMASNAQHFAPTTQSVASEARAIRDLKFRRGKAGEGQVTVDLSDPSVSIDVRQQGPDLIVDFQHTTLPDSLARKLDVTDFATPVTTVTTSQQGENVRVVISPKGLWEHTAYQTDRQFVVEVKPLKEDPSKLFQGTQRQGYQGEKVSLNFQNIPLRELLHVFADITNFNIVISDSVSGNVSLRLNDIPWDQALEIVLKQKGLAMRKSGNVVWIAPADELAAREKVELESMQAIADLEPLRTESFQLNYQKADVIEKMLRGISTATGTASGGAPAPAAGAAASKSRVLSERGYALFDGRTNKLFVTDTPTKLAEVRRLIAEIDIAVRQVLIEARIVEATDTFSKSLGARIGGSDNTGLAGSGHTINGNLRYGISATNSDVGQLMPWGPYFVPQGRITNIDNSGKITFVPLSPATSQYYQDAQFVNLPASNAAGSFALSLFSKSLGEILNLEISAMEADGKGKTVSSPRVLTADQVEAEIKQGTRTPYLQSTSSGATAISYQDAVLSLKVRPQITPDNRVIVSLDIHKDALGSLIANLGREIDTKAIKTDVLVDNGGTVVIGGIFIQEESNDVTRVPLLGDIPVLGFMFRKTDKIDNRRELLIFITPKIVSDSLAVR